MSLIAIFFFRSHPADLQSGQKWQRASKWNERRNKELNVLYEKYTERKICSLTIGFSCRIISEIIIKNYVLSKWIYLIFLVFLSLLLVGLEILAFPRNNQFAGQEPGSNEDIQDTVCIRFRAKFTIFDKVSNLTCELFFCSN